MALTDPAQAVLVTQAARPARGIVRAVRADWPHAHVVVVALGVVAALQRESTRLQHVLFAALGSLQVLTHGTLPAR